jgi:hypothetical protein
MTSITIINIIGCIGVIVMVVAPLAYAIATQYRNAPATDAASITNQRPVQPHPSRDRRTSRREPRPAYEAG